MKLNYVKSNSGNKYARQPNTRGEKTERRGSDEENSGECSGIKKKCKTEGLKIRITQWWNGGILKRLPS